MNPYSGEIFEVSDEDKAKQAGLIPVKRDLSAIERAMKQIMLYEACVCGSGKKFKFCCHKDQLTEAMKQAFRQT